MIEAQIVDDVRVAFDHLETFVALECRNVVGIDIGELDFAGAQCSDGRRRIGEIAVDHPVQLGLATAIFVVGGQFDILVGDIFGELEWSGTDRRGRPPGVLRKLIDGMDAKACSGSIITLVIVSSSACISER